MSRIISKNCRISLIRSRIRILQFKNVLNFSPKKPTKIKKIDDPAKREEAYQKARKDGLIHATRLFLGKRKNNTVELVMSDSLARPRIKLKVNEGGNPVMEFLDEKGAVTDTFPTKN